MRPGLGGLPVCEVAFFLRGWRAVPNAPGSLCLGRFVRRWCVVQMPAWAASSVASWRLGAWVCAPGVVDQAGIVGGQQRRVGQHATPAARAGLAVDQPAWGASSRAAARPGPPAWRRRPSWRPRPGRRWADGPRARAARRHPDSTRGVCQAARPSITPAESRPPRPPIGPRRPGRR